VTETKGVWIIVEGDGVTGIEGIDVTEGLCTGVPSGVPAMEGLGTIVAGMVGLGVTVLDKDGVANIVEFTGILQYGV
jgi:hypothetical protein